MKILFYGTRDYDRESFSKVMGDYPDVQIEFTKTNLTWRTAQLAQGYDAVCAFVNANANAMCVELLAVEPDNRRLHARSGVDAQDDSRTHRPSSSDVASFFAELPLDAGLSLDFCPSAACESLLFVVGLAAAEFSGLAFAVVGNSPGSVK